ncbi:MAG: tRNA (N(6)-L-threonylcarbamoyladenosine(37)-C(2))-methylthiotransferase MtaB [Lachnospiraceae bacterium]|nr:tRNA (N(6)-L-threonylcarbamoyladenosine(37)-C(2))-methylthiotransferase MtaB [Lachnospiraceae bacterium]
MEKKVALHNLGCKTNSYELDYMQQVLQEKGFTIVPFDENADIYIINTCTVTNIADRKSRQMLHRAKQKNPDAVVVAVGCYVQTGLKDVEKDPAIDLAIGNNRKKDIVPILFEYLEKHEKFGKGEGDAVDKTLNGTTVIDINHTNEYEDMHIEKTAEHTRAYIKIQDGCNQFCSYCLIPYARGRVRSRKALDIVSEIEKIVEKGYSEVVLTGIHISSYGIDFDENYNATGDYRGKGKLIELCEMVDRIPGLERLRLGSLEPRIVTEENAKRLAALRTLCPHFHLSLQSGCDDTLKRMNRHYSAAEYRDSVNTLRKYFDRPAITTDVIVGFPGEDEREFSESRAFLEDIKFYEMHVFKYSKRAGTRAADMDNQVSDENKAIRSDILLEMTEKHSKEFREKYLGNTAKVLFEEKKKIGSEEYFVGHTTDYVKVAVKDDGEINSGDILLCKIKEFLMEEVLLGQIIR